MRMESLAITCLRCVGVGELENLHSESTQWYLSLDRANFECRLGHSVDRAAGRILAKRACSCLAHGFETFDPITPHSAHDDADRAGARDIRDRMEQHIHRWLESVHRLLIDQPAVIAFCTGSQFKVTSTRCDIDRAGAEQCARSEERRVGKE